MNKNHLKTTRNTRNPQRRIRSRKKIKKMRNPRRRVRKNPQVRKALKRKEVAPKRRRKAVMMKN